MCGYAKISKLQEIQQLDTIITMAKKEKPRESIRNRKAFHDYHILEKYETGIQLQGTEVKSIRAGQANLRDNYAQIKDGEVWLHQLHISPYKHGNVMNHEPNRPRKLLMHKREISRLIGKVQQQGLTLVVLAIYWKQNWLKAELALVKGKREHDKRETVAKRDADRQMQRAIRQSI